MYHTTSTLINTTHYSYVYHAQAPRQFTFLLRNVNQTQTVQCSRICLCIHFYTTFGYPSEPAKHPIDHYAEVYSFFALRHIEMALLYYGNMSFQ